MITQVKRVHKLGNQSRLGKSKTPLANRKLLPQTSALLFGEKPMAKKHSLCNLGSFLVAVTDSKDTHSESMKQDNTPLRETYSTYHSRNCFSKGPLLKVPSVKTTKKMDLKSKGTKVSNSLLRHQYSEIIVPEMRGKHADVLSTCVQYNLTQQEYSSLRSEFSRLGTQGKVPCHSLSKEYNIPPTCFLGIAGSSDSLAWREFVLFHKLFIAKRSTYEETVHYLSTLSKFDKDLFSSSVKLPEFAKATLQKLIPSLTAESKPHSLSLVDLRTLPG